MSFAAPGQNIHIDLTAEDHMSDAFGTASASMGAFMGDADRLVSSMARVGGAAVPILAIGAAFVYAGQQAATVQQNVANLNTVLHGTADQLAAIRAQGLALSQLTQFTDAAILAGQRQLAKGGIGVSGVLEETPATLNLAAATQSDPTQAATSIITAQKAFGLGNSEASASATALAQAVDSSVGTLQSQAAALKQVGATAHAAGIDLRETVTAVADLQNSGLQNDSGTALKTFLSRIESPSKTAREEIAALNLQFYDLQGNLKPIPELFDEIRNKTLGLSQESANNALFNIFGQRGVRVADIAMEQGSTGFIDTAQSMIEKGDAAEIAGRKLDTFQGSASKALSSVNVLAVQLGTVFLPAMRGVADDTQAAANALSQLNNAAPIIPQLLAGGAAVGGLSLLNSRLSERADRRNQAGIESIASVSNQTAQAEFEADARILAAHQEMVAAMARLDQSQYEAWVAMETKTVAAFEDAETKKLASLQSITERTLASIAAIDAAQEASDRAALDRQALTFEKQQAYLKIDQEAQLKKFSVANAAGASSFDVMKGNQDVDRQVLAQKQAVDADVAEREREIINRRYAVQREAEIAGAERTIQETERQAAAQADAITKGSEETAAAQAEAAARNEAAIRERYAAETAAAESARLGKVGGVQTNAAGDVFDIEGSIANSATAGRAGRAISDTTRATIGSRIGAALGELLIPLTMVFVAKEMILDPLIDKVVDHFKNGNIKKAEVDISDIIKVTSDKGTDTTEEFKAQLDRITKLQNEAQAVVNNYTDTSGHKGVSIGGIFKDKASDEDYEAAKKQLDELAKLRSSVNDRVSLLPEQSLSKTADEQNKLIEQLRNGVITVEQADREWKNFNSSIDEATNTVRTNEQAMRSQGVTEAQIAEQSRKWTDARIAALHDLRMAQEQAQADYNQNAADAMTALQTGVPVDDASVAFFGKHTDQTEATKAEIAKAKKEITEYTDAWKQAGQAVASVDISKGIDAFASQADALRIANQELEKLGQHNAALSDLGRLADVFKQVKDAEEEATRGLDGYALTMQKTQGYATQLGQVQKEFETALEFAERRQAAGRATASDLSLINNAPNIRANLSNQQETLSEHMVLDVIGTVKNLPDFASLDTYMRDIIDKAGGGIQVVAEVKSDVETARRKIEDILKPPIDITARIIADFTQFDPALAVARDKVKGILPGGYSPYDSPSSDGGSSGAPPSGTSYVTGTQAVAANRSATGYNQFRDLTESDYTQIVKSGSLNGGATPFDDPAIYAAVMKAARDYGVDPRALLAFTKNENNNATNISPDLNMANNFGGLKYSPGDPTETRGPASPERNDDGSVSYYAAFKDPTEFFRHLADNIVGKGYEQFYQSGDLTGAATRYVAGDKPPTKEQTDSINARVNDYFSYLTKYPAPTGAASGGYGAGGQEDRTGTDVSRHGQTVSSVDQAAQSTGKLIVAKAMQSLDVEKLAGYCEQFVEETVQSITGKRGATGSKEPNATVAFNVAQGMGLETHTPKEGDLVYYPSASGGAGHVAIYIGGNKQISTQDRSSDARIHIEDVGEGARYISSTGSALYGPGDPGNRGNETGGTARLTQPYYGTSVTVSGGRTVDASGRTIDAFDKPTQTPLPLHAYPTDAVPGMQEYFKMIAGMPSEAAGGTDAIFKQLLPIMQQQESTKRFGLDGPANPFEKEQVDNAGLKDTLNIANAVGPAMQKIHDHTALTAADFKAIADAAGPIGPYLAQQVSYTEQLEQHTQALAGLKKAQADEEVRHSKALETISANEKADEKTYQDYQNRRQDENIATARTRQMVGRGEEDVAVSTAAERLKRTREEEDAQVRTSAARLVQTRLEQDQQIETAASRLTQQRSEQDAQIEITNQRRITTEAEQDWDRLESRKREMFQRTIDDERLIQSRLWEDAAFAVQQQIQGINDTEKALDQQDRNRQQAEDDRYTTLTRQEEDLRRTTEFNGGQRMVQLQDEKKVLEDQHRLTVEGAQQQQRLFVAKGQESGTEGEALAYAGQAAIIDQARKQADDLYKKQADANQREQDAEAKLHAQVMFDLETQRIAEQRSHEDALKGISREEQARHDADQQQLDLIAAEQRAMDRSHTLILRGQQDEDTVRQRATQDTLYDISVTRLSEQRMWQEDDRNRQAAILSEQRRWQDDDIKRQAAITAEQRRWQDDDVKRQDDIRSEQRRWQDIDVQRQNDIRSEQRRWQDVDYQRQLDDRNAARSYQQKKDNNDDLTRQENDRYKSFTENNKAQQTAETESISKINDQITGVKTVIALWGQLLQKFGDAATQALGTPSLPTANASTYNPNPSGLGNTPSNATFANFGTVPGHAIGGSSDPGLNRINEDGGEFIFTRGGDTIIPADQSRRIGDLLSRVLGTGASVDGGAGAGSVVQNLVFNVDGSEMAISASGKARIMAVVREVLEAERPTTIKEKMAMTGRLRRG